MVEKIPASDVRRLLRPGMTVYAPGVAGESGLLTEALRAEPSAAAHVRFVGMWLPGFNRFDYAGLDPQARATAFFIYDDLRASFAAGRIDYIPLSYFGAYCHLRDREGIDLALLHVTPPNADGRVGLGVATDFAPAVFDKAAIKVAHVNPSMPSTRGLVDFAYDDLDYVVEAPHPIAGSDSQDDPAFVEIGRHIAGLVDDGSTLEVGVGRVQSVFGAFTGKRDLRIHAGAITDSVRRLANSGALADEPGAITTGIAWGGDALYQFCAEDPRVRFAPVGWTHDVSRIGQIDRFVAINGVIEVDLLGQANAEMVDGRQISSAGGLTDFMHGARLSPEGFSVVALPASARRGTVSRIVPQLDAGTSVSAARTAVDVVVTENGVADLRGLGIDARAEALIAVADPSFHGALQTAWRERRARM